MLLLFMTLLFLQRQLFTIAPQNSYSKNLANQRKVTVMEFFFNKVADCDLLKRDVITVSFGRVL